MNTLILSDAHLTTVNERGRERVSFFLSFLRTIDPKRCSRLIIVGDLFDFWFEYRHVIFSCYFDVLRAFADLHDHGVELYFICGNHDFWAGRFLQEQLGFRIFPGALTLRFGDKRALLIHGDGLAPNDYAYRAYKRVARNPFVVGLFRLLHPDWAMALARAVAGSSRRLFMARDVSQGPQVAPLREFARRTLAHGEADIVICGHSHFPVIEEFPTPSGTGLYINSGDWIFHRSYVEWDGERFTLLRFGPESEIKTGGKAQGSDEEC